MFTHSTPLEIIECDRHSVLSEENFFPWLDTMDELGQLIGGFRDVDRGSHLTHLLSDFNSIIGSDCDRSLTQTLSDRSSSLQLRSPLSFSTGIALG